MPISGYFDTIFGISGNLTAVPDAAQVDGSVSYTDGYPILYETPVGSGGLNIDRAQMNQLFNDITTAIQLYQQTSIPPFITSTMNGGSPYSYSEYNTVMLGGIAYQSNTNSNTDTPPSSKWNALPLGWGTMAGQFANAVAITGGTLDGVTIGGTTPAVAIAATTITAGAGGIQSNFDIILETNAKQLSQKNSGGTLYRIASIDSSNILHIGDNTNGANISMDQNVILSSSYGLTATTLTAGSGGVVSAFDIELSVNQKRLSQKDSGGTVRTLISLNNSNQLNIGDTGSTGAIQLSANGFTSTIDTAGNYNSAYGITSQFDIQLKSNGKQFSQYDSGGTLRRVASVDSSNNLQLGDSNLTGIVSTNIGFGVGTTTVNVIAAQTTGTTVTTSGIIRNYIPGGGGLNLGINTSGASFGIFYYDGATVIGSIAANGTTAVSYNTSSDERLKSNIAPLLLENVNGNIIDQLQPITYTWEHAKGKPSGIGFSAQQLAKVIPEAVTPGDSGPVIEGQVAKRWGVDHGWIVPHLVNEVKSLRLRVKALEQRVSL
jgi:Chaperone of endosialidase